MSNHQTSIEALQSIETEIPNITERVYRYILSKGDEGITDDAGFKALGMNPNTYRPCRINLYKKGLVLNTKSKGTTESGRKAWKWKAVPKSEAIEPTNVETRLSKNTYFNPPVFPTGKGIEELTLGYVRKRMNEKIDKDGHANCPCCGTRFTGRD